MTENKNKNIQGRTFLGDIYGDVCITVGDRDFVCSKSRLCSESDYFCRLFSDNSKHHANEYVLCDLSPEIFEIILCCLYDPNHQSNYILTDKVRLVMGMCERLSFDNLKSVLNNMIIQNSDLSTIDEIMPELFQSVILNSDPVRFSQLLRILTQKETVVQTKPKIMTEYDWNIIFNYGHRIINDAEFPQELKLHIFNGLNKLVILYFIEDQSTQIIGNIIVLLSDIIVLHLPVTSYHCLLHKISNTQITPDNFELCYEIAQLFKTLKKQCHDEFQFNLINEDGFTFAMKFIDYLEKKSQTISPSSF